jgi:TRAP-type C4-dicarboxylate transport system permease small subunit
MRRFVGRFNLVLASVAGAVMLALVLLTASDVTGRYLFNAPITWSLEIGEYLLVFCVYFGMAYSVQTGAHISVELVYQRLSRRIQRNLDAAVSILVLVFWIVLLWQTSDMAIGYLQRNVKSETILATPLFYPMLLVVIGSFATCVQVILNIYDNFVRLLSGKS